MKIEESSSNIYGGEQSDFQEFTEKSNHNSYIESIKEVVSDEIID